LPVIFFPVQKTMKPQKRLIDEIACMDNLNLAFYKAQKGKAAHPEVLAYRRRLQANLLDLQRQIVSGDIETGHARSFTIYDPKKRVICAAPFSQRVLHHALMNLCHVSFERYQIDQSFASRPGKGTYAALETARRYHRRYRWFLKLDVRKYFESIDHEVLKSQLHRLFSDTHLLGIFETIIDSHAGSAEGKGVPIGNLTSQYFANHYLAALDHRVREAMHAPAYARYMDDMVLWSDDKTRLLETGRRFQHEAAANLRLALKPFCLNMSSKGLPFLGYLLYPGHVRLSQRSRKRFIEKSGIYAEKLMSGEWTQKEYAGHVMPLEAFTGHADSRELRKSVYCRAGIVS
jgi:RNA-directed DNA polymerase